MSMNRKKLLKLMGKEVEWEATLIRHDDKCENALLLNVTHNGKEYTDHVWISLIESIRKIPFGSRIKFFGTAKTYVDSHGVRKNGLYQCHGHELFDEDYEKAIKDGSYRQKRINSMNHRRRN